MCLPIWPSSGIIIIIIYLLQLGLHPQITGKSSLLNVIRVCVCEEGT
jgi:hypothetical protein